jgi:polar amino acid transport system substrate-binding protein
MIRWYLARLFFAACLFLTLKSVYPARAAETLHVASDISYAPLEFYRPNSHVATGFDYDLALALGKRLGRPVTFTNHDFSTILADLARGKYDLVLSAVSDTRAREHDVDFIDYLLVGSGILTKAGDPAHISDLSSLCGYTVDVQKGSSQESALAALATKCTSIGLKPPVVLAADTDEAALKHLLAGESVAHLSDYPTIAYLALTLDHGHGYVVAGRQFGLVPYGIAVAKNKPALRDAVQKALASMIADGSYDALVAKWHLEQAAYRAATINAGTKF